LGKLERSACFSSTSIWHSLAKASASHLPCPPPPITPRSVGITTPDRTEGALPALHPGRMGDLPIGEVLAVWAHKAVGWASRGLSTPWGQRPPGGYALGLLRDGGQANGLAIEMQWSIRTSGAEPGSERKPPHVGPRTGAGRPPAVEETRELSVACHCT